MQSELRFLTQVMCFLGFKKVKMVCLHEMFSISLYELNTLEFLQA